MKKLTIAALAATGLIATSNVASAQVFCVFPLMISAAIVGAQENRELTQTEAMWCGLVREQQPAKAKATKKKVAKTGKKQ
jgi:hypothetical protein